MTDETKKHDETKEPPYPISRAVIGRFDTGKTSPKDVWTKWSDGRVTDGNGDVVNGRNKKDG